jgi:hypothetical protein
MEALRLLDLPGRRRRDALRICSTPPDSTLRPDRIMAWYRERGRQFLALAVHTVSLEARSVSVFIAISRARADRAVRDSWS